ncbi:MAG: hypothetical protein K2F63_05390, partial [Muribaculaceae bacterium]|nr:hypothetical protein [Muribaculaceae bacterium]
PHEARALGDMYTKQSLDRFTEGLTPLNIFISGKDSDLPVPASLTRYELYPDEGFDIVWPRIDEGDIVLFGGHYAIDSRMRPRLARFLANAIARKALMIYLPGFLPQQEPRVTRVMPAILENLEMANLVITRNKDLELIFGLKHPGSCYHDHIDFYCRSMINTDVICNHITYYSGKEMTQVEIPGSTSATMLWNAGAAAGIVAAIAKGKYTAADLEAPSEQLRQQILSAAAMTANEAAKSISRNWQKIL